MESGELPEGRVLGLLWDPVEDNFKFYTNFHKVPKEIASGEMRPTKRQTLKLVMSVFDPLGFLAPLIIKAKILLQEIWRSKIGWDDEIPEHLYQKWKMWILELQGIKESRISRCYSLHIPATNLMELHVFVDGSE